LDERKRVVRNYFDDLIARKFELGNVGGIAGHEIAVQNAENRFVSDDQKIVFFAFELENDGLHAYGKVVI
jgi:hypothetical protein